MLDVLLHLNTHLGPMVSSLGPWIYVLLFAIIFAETGLVVTPFLPGDSLLFAVGALCALPQSGLEVTWIVALLIVAAILGDAVNYSIGAFFGERFLAKSGRLIRREHLDRTHAFYERHGGKTIILARFVPIVRTFAPFVAGLAKMNYRHFALYNIVGGITWIMSFTLGGYWFGNIPSIQRNFHVVILAILVLSVLPIVIEFIRARRSRTV